MEIITFTALISFVFYFVALLFITNTRINAFTIRKSYNMTDAPPQDLSVGESLQLEVRHDLKKPNGIDGDALNKSSESTANNNYNAKGTSAVISSFAQITTTTGFTEPYTNAVTNQKLFVDDDSEKLTTKSQIPEPLTSQSLKISNNNESNMYDSLTLARQINDMANSMTVSVEEIQSKAGPRFNITTDNIVTVSDATKSLTKEEMENKNVSYTTNTYFTLPEATEYSTVSVKNNSSDNNASLPTWKKYTVIDRKRVTASDVTILSTGIREETITESTVTMKDSIISDTFTSIKRAEDLQPLALEISTLDFIPTTLNYQKDTDTEHLEMTTQFEELLTLETVFSKRAGFLNLSTKSKETDGTTESYIFDTTTESNTLTTLETNLEERIKSIFADEPGSQRYRGDAVKEVLLQETLLNNEEFTKQNSEVLNTGTIPTNTAEYFNTYVTNQETELTPQTDVSVTEPPPNNNSISKAKSTKMYAVNPNYKPMKKIEVQPPKTFVRDPDDNSWRNESISSLGIVFKPKNSSKPFTQVLKNKTEIEWSNLLSKDSKNDVPDLRERLEKIAQRRKTKKKKVDVFGNFIYSDYEESNSSEEITNIDINDLTPASITTEELTTFSEVALSTIPILTTQTPNTVTTPELTTSTQSEEIVSTTSISESDTDTILRYIPLTEKSTTTSTPETDSPVTNTSTSLTTKVTTFSNNLNFTQSVLSKQILNGSSTTDKPKKIFKTFDYYDSDEDDESEYLELAKLELKKKNTAPNRYSNAIYTTLPPLPFRFTALPPYLPDRQPTIQYFPPRITKPPKSNKFDDDFEKKTKYNTKKTSSKNFVPITNAQVIQPPTPHYMFNSPLPNLLTTQSYRNLEQSTIKPDNTLLPLQLPTMYKSAEYTGTPYQTTQLPITSVPDNGYGVVDHNKGFNRGTYVVKNYKDFLEQAAKDYDYERDPEFVQYTASPLRGMTISDLATQDKDRIKTNPNFNYDYDVKFRKEVLQRFVDNFNHNEARFNDFPVLYNNTVLHVNLAENSEAVASSRAFLKGLYNPSDTRLGYARREPYDSNCDKCTVELSPAYELHYYVPDQEEKEEAEPKPTGIPLP